MFANVEMEVAVSHPVVRVPSSAVIADARGNRVATVDAVGRVHLLTVVRGLDNGREIDLVDGLQGGEQVIVNPGGDVTDGLQVQAATGP
jgi:multidrug efflux pump subunit AcrA (membrane-fusion protein)